MQEKQRTNGNSVAVRVYQMKRKVIAIGTVLQSVWPVGRDESKINLVFKDGLRQLTLIALPRTYTAIQAASAAPTMISMKFLCVINWQTGLIDDLVRFYSPFGRELIARINHCSLSSSVDTLSKCWRMKKTSPKTASNLLIWPIDWL